MVAIPLLRAVLLAFCLYCSRLNWSRLMTKPTKWHVGPAKTQISLGIRPVWSEFWLSAWRKLGSLATLADAQADLSLRWAHSHFVGFVMRQLKFVWVPFPFGVLGRMFEFDCIGSWSLPFHLFLAHLSRRLTRWAYSIPMLWRPLSSLSTMFKKLLLWNRLANQSQIVCGTSLGRGNESLYKWSRSHDQGGRHAHIW